MKAIIIEDEKPAARNLNRILDKLGVQVIAVLHNTKDAINWINENDNPDLGFFDIQLGDGLSFEIFDAIKIDFPVIFTTAFDEYAIKAFKVNSIDYLLKPIDEEEMSKALKKYKRYYQEGKIADNTNNIDRIAKLLIPKSYKKRFSIKIGQKYKLIDTNDISCFFSQDKSTYLKTKGNRNHLLDLPLENLVNILDSEQFFRVSRKYIVNVNSIEEIYAFSNSRLSIKLKNINIEGIIVSREKVKSFKEWLNR
ncbi:MAG TPA: response regulator transcription factor [Bacteroidetes bacterium]|nr:response regulator transcription factor [Flavobacteriia bacterium]HHH52933.1 response regulator transcription factor [Bacteroidota bacterium]